MKQPATAIRRVTRPAALRLVRPLLQASVVVPTCARPALLECCLRALLRQTAERYEVIVVDDRPREQTRAVVRRLAAPARVRGVALRYLPNHGRHGPAAARNAGWRAASATVVAFTDDDTEPDPDWLRAGLRAFGTRVDAVCGRVVMPVPATPTDYERDARGLESAEFVTANCLVRRATLARLGGFDERFPMAWREDSDLHFRLLESGARIVRAPDAVVVHPVRPGRWGISLAQQRKVMFDALLYKKHPRLYRLCIRAAPRWDYYAITTCLLASAVLAPFFPWAAAPCALAWAALTGRLFALRLRGCSRRPAHVAEMAVTSALIPPLAVYWRVRGMLRFRVAFA